jgi:superfamily II DNA or RNA helicase
LLGPVTSIPTAPSRLRGLPPWPQGRSLRDWQQEAIEAVAAHSGSCFLASATPAAGKTTFGLRVAYDMISSGRVERVVVAAPTTHICRQWSADAARYGLDLEPNRPNAEGREPRDRHGVAVTYQTIAAGPRTHARASQRPTLLIADEPHHMGDHAAWGTRAREAFGGAVFRLLLSGTPFRSDSSPIPWVTYDEDGVSIADYSYGYARALLDGVCRPIAFHPYDGEMEWRADGRLRRATFEQVLPRAEAARRLRTALDPAGDWMGQVLHEADTTLSKVRAQGHPDAGGLVVASDQEHARAIAARLGQLSGETPEIVMSDEPEASARIAAFSASSRRWLVSVLMVSEGVDIPRLRVGVYATAARTELFFRQVVGRFVRRTPAPARQMSYLLLPADERLKRLAFQIEEERRHAVELGADEDGEVVEPELMPERGAAGERFEALSSTAAELAGEIYSETTMQLFPTDDDPPRAAPAPRVAAPPPPAEPEPETASAARRRLRAERSRLAALVAGKTGEPHSAVHGRINRATGVSNVGAATREQLEKGNELLTRELWR